jgi:hypothetical protein
MGERKASPKARRRHAKISLDKRRAARNGRAASRERGTLLAHGAKRRISPNLELKGPCSDALADSI